MHTADKVAPLARKVTVSPQQIEAAALPTVAADHSHHKEGSAAIKQGV